MPKWITQVGAVRITANELEDFINLVGLHLDKQTASRPQTKGDRK
mgnify:FL=1|jgi:hypothetical protein